MKILPIVTGTVAVLAMSNGVASAQECKPSKWGADDEIGAANYVTPESVLAIKGVVEHNYLVCQGLVSFQVSEEERKGEGRPVARTERVLEARHGRRRLIVAKIDGSAVNDKLIT